MGFRVQLRERLASTLGNRPAAVALTNTIVIGSIAANAFDSRVPCAKCFIADDNDGNLANGTPHSPDLIFACNLHSLRIRPARSANDEVRGCDRRQSTRQRPVHDLGATTFVACLPCASAPTTSGSATSHRQRQPRRRPVLAGDWTRRCRSSRAAAARS